MDKLFSSTAVKARLSLEIVSIALKEVHEIRSAESKNFFISIIF
jgi:hypothetical protein